MEIERKFLVNEIPNLTNIKYEEFTQVYLSIDPEIRMRNVNNQKYYLTKKGTGDLVREEVEVEIDKLTYDILTTLVYGRTINKTRYYINLDNGLVSELDIYHNELDGLVTVENEFNSEKDANNFNIPSWYGKEITKDKKYKNKNIAKCDDKELKLIKKNY